MKIGKAKFYKDVTENDWKIFAQDLDISYKIVQNELIRQKTILPEAFEILQSDIPCEILNKIKDYYLTISV